MIVQTMLPRGIRNNNPLNIRLNPENRWQGRLSPRLNWDGAFEQFQDPIMGLRAAAVLLIAHYDRRHLDTIRKLVEVWAPPNENDTEAYARCVAKESGFGIDEPLDLHDYACLRPILTAMIRVENGASPTPMRRSTQHWSAPGWCRRSARCSRRGRSKAGRWPPPAPSALGRSAPFRRQSARRTTRSSASCRTSMRRSGDSSPSR